MEIRSDRKLDAIVTKISTDGYVDGPAAEFDTSASYTFEAEVNGRRYRWTGQRPTIDGDRARFWLRDGTPINAPSGGTP